MKKRWPLFLLITACALTAASCGVSPKELSGKTFTGTYQKWTVELSFTSEKDGKLCSTRAGVPVCNDFTYETKGNNIVVILMPFSLSKTFKYEKGNIMASGFALHLDQSQDYSVTLSPKPAK